VVQAMWFLLHLPVAVAGLPLHGGRAGMAAVAWGPLVMLQQHRRAVTALEGVGPVANSAAGAIRALPASMVMCSCSGSESVKTQHI